MKGNFHIKQSYLPIDKSESDKEKSEESVLLYQIAKAGDITGLFISDPEKRRNWNKTKEMVLTKMIQTLERNSLSMAMGQKASKPRLSNITFSTVTSATGLPTIAAEPSRPRSSSYWKQPEHEGCESTSRDNEHYSQPQTSSAPATDTSILIDKKQKEDSLLIRTSKNNRNTQSDEVDANVVACSSLEQTSGFVILLSDGTTYSCEELNSNDELVRIAEWDFPIFHFAEQHPTTILSRDCKTIPALIFTVCSSVEHSLLNHNRIHAADVLHGCYYLTCHPVCASLGTSANPESSSLPTSDKSPLPLSGNMSTLEGSFFNFNNLKTLDSEHLRL
ncbi:hypothetical protein X798_01099 [Onchocerca flexuosa]|uniref:Uncharacterized protein n=1 Tax=Onchocerca flexuosa TaxID=387005 RepID=A0A238C4T4_9BILA|nr:hypothetical protein X798_01099 [Onchocerca flexuosa]